MLYTLFTYNNNRHSVSPLFLLVGQISVPHFENGVSEKRKSFWGLKRVSARYICLGVTLFLVFMFFVK